MNNLAFLSFLTSSGGSWVIYLLIAFSIVAVAVIIERLVIVNRVFAYQDSALNVVSERLEMGPNEVLKGLKKDSLLYRVANELIHHANSGTVGLERHLESRLALERRGLEKRVIILGTLGNNAPFVGLLGTVLGVIKAFHDLGASAGQGPEVVMQGISEALVATAVGIIVALPCVAAFNYIKKRIKDILVDADRFGHQLIAVLQQKPGRRVEA